jgi:hypothetical protein
MTEMPQSFYALLAVAFIGLAGLVFVAGIGLGRTEGRRQIIKQIRSEKPFKVGEDEYYRATRVRRLETFEDIVQESDS